MEEQKSEKWSWSWKTFESIKTLNEINSFIEDLRKNLYPKPDDCEMRKCSGFRPSCRLGVCYFAVDLCTDF